MCHSLAGTREQTETLARVINSLRLNDGYDGGGAPGLQRSGSGGSVHGPLSNQAAAVVSGGSPHTSSWYIRSSDTVGSVPAAAAAPETAAVAAPAGGVSGVPVAFPSLRVRAAAYHAGFSAEERARIHSDFMLDKTRVVCATVAFGMVGHGKLSSASGRVVTWCCCSPPQCTFSCRVLTSATSAASFTGVLRRPLSSTTKRQGAQGGTERSRAASCLRALQMSRTCAGS
jgi:hypothetical protein